MRYLGSYPGAYTFRFLMIFIIVGSFVVLFFNYTDKLAVETEKASIQQTINIINSSLAVVFATYAVKGELDRLNELNGGNPFKHMFEYDLFPSRSIYQGEISGRSLGKLDPGWYYDGLNKRVIYKAYSDGQVNFYSLKLDYQDLNGSGRFESGIDGFQYLYFTQIPQQ